MTKDLCGVIVAQYLESLRSEFVTHGTPSACSFITPFVRPDGDNIEVFAERRLSGSFVLSDMGETFAYLYLSGLAISRKLQEDARRISARYGVRLEVNELVTEVRDTTDAGGALNRLTQAVMSVAALIEKRRPWVNFKFDEAIEATIIGEGKTYDPDYDVPGATKIHRVKFHINSGKNLLIQPLSQSNELQATHTAERWYYHFDDIRKANPRWSNLALLDDRGERGSVWTPEARAPLQAVSIVIPWSERERFVEVLQTTNDVQLLH